jgi:predicted RNase H-like HicB family nuclease
MATERRGNDRVNRILARPYRRVLVPDPESGGFTAMIDEFPGCISEGDTAGEAMANLEEAAVAWIEAAIDSGQEVPGPTQERSHSGRFLVRMGSGLHARVAESAHREGVSINQFIVAALAERVGSSRPQATPEFRVVVVDRGSARRVAGTRTTTKLINDLSMDVGRAATSPTDWRTHFALAGT